jgi:hypothetical protein
MEEAREHEITNTYRSDLTGKWKAVLEEAMAEERRQAILE